MSKKVRRLILAAVYVVLIAGLLFLLVYERFIAPGEVSAGLLVSPRDGSPYAMTSSFTSADNGGESGRFGFDLRFRHDSPETVTEGDTTYYYDDGAEIAITRYRTSGGQVLVADIYISDISRIRTALANDAFAKASKEDPAETADRAGALLAITGNNYSEGEIFTEMRDGVLYSRDGTTDACALMWDGSLEVIPREDFDVTGIMEAGAYQIWSEGRILVKDGQMPEGVSDGYRARRCAIGCVEKGHYVFVLTEGKMSLETLARNMLALSCESAYSLYGGSAADMIFDGVSIGFDSLIDRKCADIIYITSH